MRETGITRKELDQALRSAGEEPEPSSVAAAYLDRDGSVSVVPASQGPRVLEVTVANGAQTVRIALE